jgi:hypothetical protein
MQGEGGQDAEIAEELAYPYQLLLDRLQTFLVTNFYLRTLKWLLMIV